jgi:hypothetical protein
MKGERQDAKKAKAGGKGRGEEQVDRSLSFRAQRGICGRSREGREIPRSGGMTGSGANRRIFSSYLGVLGVLAFAFFPTGSALCVKARRDIIAGLE